MREHQPASLTPTEDARPQPGCATPTGVRERQPGVREPPGAATHASWPTHALEHDAAAVGMHESSTGEPDPTGGARAKPGAAHAPQLGRRMPIRADAAAVTHAGAPTGEPDPNRGARPATGVRDANGMREPDRGARAKPDAAHAPQLGRRMPVRADAAAVAHAGAPTGQPDANQGARRQPGCTTPTGRARPQPGCATPTRIARPQPGCASQARPSPRTPAGPRCPEIDKPSSPRSWIDAGSEIHRVLPSRPSRRARPAGRGWR